MGLDRVGHAQGASLDNKTSILTNPWIDTTTNRALGRGRSGTSSMSSKNGPAKASQSHSPCLPCARPAHGPNREKTHAIVTVTLVRHTHFHAQVIDFRSFGECPAKGLATSLYIGSKADAKAEKTLRERGVKFVLNCTPTRK